MAPPARDIQRFADDEAGQAQVEWVLVLVGFGIPIMFTFVTLLTVLVTHYERIAFLEGLPFP